MAGSTATRLWMESLLAFKRAGADGILTYFAPRVEERLKALRLKRAFRIRPIARSLSDISAGRLPFTARLSCWRDASRRSTPSRSGCAARRSLPSMRSATDYRPANISRRTVLAEPADRLRGRAIPGRPIIERFVICRFAAEGLSPNKADLVEICRRSKVRYPAPASLSAEALLSRQPGGDRPATRIAPGALAARRKVPPNAFAYLGQQLLSGLPRTAIYGLLAVAYSLVFGPDRAHQSGASARVAAIGAGRHRCRRRDPPCGGQGCAHPSADGFRGGPCRGHVRGRDLQRRRRLSSSGGIHGPEQPAEPYRHRRVVALSDGVSAPRAEPVTVWLPPVWSAQWPLAAGRGFPRHADARVAGHRRDRAWRARPLSSGLMRGDRLRPRLAGLRRRSGAAALFGVDGARSFIQTLALAGAMAGLSGHARSSLQYGGLALPAGSSSA